MGYYQDMLYREKFVYILLMLRAIFGVLVSDNTLGSQLKTIVQYKVKWIEDEQDLVD